MDEYTIESLKDLDSNMLYDGEHGVNESDVKKVNALISILEKDLKESLLPGVIIVCKGEKKTYENGALDCKYHWHTDDYNICTQPFIPNVRLYESEACFSPLSGGYWFSETDDKKFKYIGTRKKLFWTWGHCGCCGNGGVHFEAEVGVWELESEEIY